MREPQTEQDSFSTSVANYKFKIKIQLCLGKVKKLYFWVMHWEEYPPHKIERKTKEVNVQ